MTIHTGPLREIIETAILGLVVFLLAREAVQNFQVEGRSMEPTLATSELVLVNKFAYWDIDLGPFDALIPGALERRHPGRRAGAGARWSSSARPTSRRMISSSG